MGGYLISNWGWRSAFYIPAAIAAAVALLLVNRLRDTPESLGLPPIEQYHGGAPGKPAQKEKNESFKEIFVKYILKNKYIWYICFANAFVYVVRIGILDWAPTFLTETKQSSLGSSGLKVAGFEIAGILGALLAGWMSDTVFRGRRGPANVLFMIGVVACMIVLWKTPPGHPWMDAATLVAVGFLVYGPQMLVGVAAADFASKKAASTATGLTGTFGYLGSAICGIGTGLIVDRWGWDGGFLFFIASACIATVLFLLTWSAKPVSIASEGTDTQELPVKTREISVSHSSE
jgi:sugar phosphate permease